VKAWTTAELIAKAKGTNAPKAMDPARRQLGRANKHAGKRAETLVLSTLRLHGLEVNAIETGWRVVRQFDRVTGKSKIISATPLAKVLADVVGVLPGGRALLIEVKHHEEDRLSWSCLEDHQVANLDRWSRLGACVGVAWVRGLDIALIPWRPESDQWANGLPIRWEIAQHINVLPLLTGRTRVLPSR
jgi:Holliday junction resolvase